MATAPLHLPYLNRFRPLAYLLVLIAFSGFAYAEPNWPWFVAGITATALSWWLVEGPHGKPLPRYLINLGVVAAAAGLYYELVIAPENRDIRQANLLLALGHFMGGILLCKLFERKSNRDYAQILTLTLLIMVAGAIVATASLQFAFLLAVYLALGLYVILLFHLRSETERALAAKLASVEGGYFGDSPGAIRQDIRRVALWSAVLLVSIAALLFLLVPRSAGREYLPSWGGSFTTGFTEQVRMQGDYVNLHQSEAVVMEVRLEENGNNLGSESYAPYFRGTVLDAYNAEARTWVRSAATGGAVLESRDLPAGGAAATLVPPGQYRTAGAITQVYNLRSATTNYLPAIGPPVTFASEQLRTVLFSPRDYLLAVRGAILHPLNYTVTSPVLYDAALFQEKPFVPPGDLGLAPTGFGGGTVASTVPDKVAALARTVAGDLLPAAGEELKPEKVRPIAERFQNYLRSHYPYSMKFHAVDRSLDPTEDFLLNRQSIGGHCEFFASAMVMMCRAVGINARMAAGYHGGEYNSLGGFYLVKDKDAHAWVEVFLPERGWATFDPSPAGRGNANVSAIRRWFQEVSELAQKAWLSTVVAFDNTSRKYIFNTVSALAGAATAWVKREVQAGAAWTRELLFGAQSPLWRRLLGYAALAALAAATGWLGKWWQRRRTSQLPLILKTVDRKVQRQLAHELVFVDDLLRMLGRRGRRKRLEETPREYVEDHAAMLGPAAGDARWLIGTFYDIRFGTIHVTGTLRERIGQALQHVRWELQR